MSNTTRDADNARIAAQYPDQARGAILAALDRWIRQRPGLEWTNYGNAKTYRAEIRSIAKDKRDAETLLAAVRRRSSIDAAALLEAFRGAFSGRLSVTLADRGGDVHARLDYCTGQYWPTEYRRAACAVLSLALWQYFRESCPSDATLDAAGVSSGSWIRGALAEEFGRSLAVRWFDYDNCTAADWRMWQTRASAKGAA